MEVLNSISQFFKLILPVAGVAVLVALLVVLIKVIVLLKKLNGTMDMVNGYVSDFSVTVKTVNNLAFSIEAIRVSIETMIKKTTANWNKQYEQVKAMVTQLLEKLDKKSTPEKPEEVIIGSDVKEATTEKVEATNIEVKED